MIFPVSRRLMFTTSRYASVETRRAAKALAESAGEPFVARGKKTIDQLAGLARRMGQSGISVVEERGGKPAVIATIRVDERGRWAWDTERLLNSTG